MNPVAGSGGGQMPLAPYLKKIEMTCVAEGQSFDEYMRDQIKNYGPEKPAFEHEMPRYNNFSEDRLNLRHCGSRSTVEPILPDGAFLGITGKDPRGWRVEPNLRKHRDQQFARSRFVKRFPDADHSTVSGVHNPVKILKEMRGQYYRVKDQYKNFDTSLVGRSHGGIGVINPSTDRVCMTRADGRGPNMADEMCNNTGRAISNLNEKYPSGWHTRADHRFKIARYNQNRPTMGISEMNWSKNRANAVADHDILVSHEGQMVPTSLIRKMADIVKQRQEEITSASQMIFTESRDMPSARMRAVTKDDLSRRAVVRTQPASAHAQLPDFGRTNVSGSLMKPQDETLRRKTIINPVIFEQVCRVNPKMSKRERDDLRESVKRSGETYILDIEQTNRQHEYDMNNQIIWDTDMRYDKGVSRRVANYTRNPAMAGGQTGEGVAYEGFKGQSAVSTQRAPVMPSIYEPNVANDVEYSESYTSQFKSGLMGSKYMVDYMESSGDPVHKNDLIEVTNR